MNRNAGSRNTSAGFLLRYILAPISHLHTFPKSFFEKRQGNPLPLQMLPYVIY